MSRDKAGMPDNGEYANDQDVTPEQGDNSSSQRDKQTNLGVTPYRGRPLSGATAVVSYYQTPRYKGFERRLYEDAAELGIRATAVEQAVGIWQGSFEPSVSVEVEGNPIAVRSLASRLQARYNQDAVMVFMPDKNASGVLFTLEGVRDADYANAVLQRYNISGARFVGNKLEIADPDGSLAARVMALCKALGIQFTAAQGQIEFISR